MRNNISMVSASNAHQRPSARSKTPFWVWLILAGIVLSTAMGVVQDHATRGDPDDPATNGDQLLVYHPEPWALQLGRVSLLLTFAGAGLAFARSRLRMRNNYLILLCLFIGYSLIMAARNLQPSDFLSSTFFSTMAPGCAIFSCLIFASSDKEAWRTLARAIAYGTLGISIIALFAMTQIRWASRAQAYWHLYTYSSILEISAIVAFGWFAKTHRVWLGSIPIAVLIAVSIVMQARLMLVELISLAFFYRLFSQHKLSSRAVIGLCLGGLIFLGGLYLAWYSPNAFRSALPGSAAALLDRATVDTRSAQFVNFFAKVPAKTFILGIGVPRPGEFNGSGSNGIDLGYVNMLFLGGIPCLVLFFLLHQLPAIRCIGSRFDSLDTACLASIMTYSVGLFSSTVPLPGAGYFILMLLVGRSITLLEQKNLHCTVVRHAPAERIFRPRETVAVE